MIAEFSRAARRKTLHLIDDPMKHKNMLASGFRDNNNHSVNQTFDQIELPRAATQ